MNDDNAIRLWQDDPLFDSDAWDDSTYQGKRPDQVAFSATVAGWCFTLVILALVIAGIAYGVRS